MLDNREGLTRRDLLKRTVSAGALVAIGAGFVAAPDAAWAMEVTEDLRTPDGHAHPDGA